MTSKPVPPMPPTWEPDDYTETKAAIFRAREHLEHACTELVSAEAFAETGTTGRMRRDVIEELKKARYVALMAARHAGSALGAPPKGHSGHGDKSEVG
jgi:hypothetical protein